MRSVTGWGTPSAPTRTRIRASIRQVVPPASAVKIRNVFSISEPAGPSQEISRRGSNDPPAGRLTSIARSGDRNSACGAAICVSRSGSPSFVMRQLIFQVPGAARVTASGATATRGGLS